MAADDNRPVGRKIRKIDGRPVVFDGEGFFDDPDDWSEAAAQILAEEIGLDRMTHKHWQVLRFLRDYYYQNGRAPLNRELRIGLSMRINEIEALFPGGVKYGARRLAGLPNPKSCM